MIMKLELKHLAPYLPYKLKCWVKDYPLDIGDNAANNIYELHAIYSNGECVFHDLVESQQGFQEIKPILRPLSNMDYECDIHGEKFTPYDRLKDVISEAQWLQICELITENPDYQLVVDLPYWYIENLIKWHFDIFGLIEKGLAIDINNIDKKLNN